MRALKTKITYANVTATLAVVLALTGVGYAAGRIHGSELAKRSVAGVKLKKNTVTGKEVRESRLRRVPRARRANNAARVDGFDAADLRIQCASGLVYAAGVCFETAERPAQVYRLAVPTCQAESRRLPTHNELQAFLSRDDVSVAEGGELTSNLTQSPSNELNVVVMTDDTGNATFVPAGGTSSPHAFRCVEPRAN